MAPPRPPSRGLHTSSTLRLGRFACGPGDALWRADNQIGPWPLLAFPGTAVEILQSGRPAIVATPHRVILYNARQEYRRRLVDARGDHCVFVTLAPALLQELLEANGIDGGDPERPFHGAAAPLDLGLAARPLLLACAAERRAPGVDVLAIEEEALAIVAAVLQRMPARAAAPIRGTAARHTELARALACELALRFADHDDLATLASRVGASPFHAARVFRAATGASLHAWRHELRLHAALLRLAEPGDDLAAIAVDVGFASHSHLSEAFRRALGAPPSRIRAALRSGLLRIDDASTILKARRPGPR